MTKKSFVSFGKIDPSDDKTKVLRNPSNESVYLEINRKEKRKNKDPF